MCTYVYIIIIINNNYIRTLDITYIALLADITADNAELTGYSTTTNVRLEL